MTGPFAGSNPALGTKKFTREDYARAREKYRPDKIRILLVAESPPASGGYFYFPRTIGKDHLFRETMKALNLWRLLCLSPRVLTRDGYWKIFSLKASF